MDSWTRDSTSKNEKLAHLIVIMGVMSLIIGQQSLQSATISDSSFFAPIPHSLITFDTDGAGNPVVLSQGALRPMPASEYASQGVSFSSSIFWVNDGSTDFDIAQSIGGSLPIGIPGGSRDDFVMSFTGSVRAFGFWVIDNNTLSDTPVFTALDGAGQVIASATFDAFFRAGTVGIADYGFMGIVVDQNIASVHITKDAAVLDNLYFSPVPEPTVLSLAVMGLLSLGIRCRLKRG